jgi:hypothetical protein
MHIDLDVYAQLTANEWQREAPNQTAVPLLSAFLELTQFWAFLFERGAE